MKSARLVLAAALAALSCAVQAAPAPKPDLAVLPAEVRGVVLLPDGGTPVDKLQVRVWDAATEEIVYKTETDESGTFTVPRLEEGNHYITVGPVRIDMRVFKRGRGIQPQPHGIVVVIPKRMPMIPALLPGAAAAAALPKVMSP